MNGDDLRDRAGIIPGERVLVGDEPSEQPPGLRRDGNGRGAALPFPGTGLPARGRGRDQERPYPEHDRFGWNDHQIEKGQIAKAGGASIRKIRGRDERQGETDELWDTERVGRNQPPQQPLIGLAVAQPIERREKVVLQIDRYLGRQGIVRGIDVAGRGGGGGSLTRSSDLLRSCGVRQQEGCAKHARST